ncbi:MAG: hypothetical protein HDR15_10335 [Lachnospiraceae bacterium]|nr:hypothetical protein [Lachnospiraceae bacterium]
MAMPWCPVCKNEYKEGVTVCADCGETLVASLGERKEVLLCSGEEALILRMQKFMEYNDIPVIFEHEDEEACLYVLPKHERKAKQAVRVFLVESALKEEAQNQEDDLICADAADGEESEEEAEDRPDAEDGENDLRAPSGVYRKKSERADDLRSSGEVLLVFGILGCIAMILIDFGILPIRFGNRIMMNVIMFALFLFFIGFGVYSLKDARKSRAEASDEDKLTEQIHTWVKEHLTAELVDEASGLEEEDADEIRFFKRTEVIKKKITAEFQEAEEAYLDNLAETVYQELFE